MVHVAHTWASSAAENVRAAHTVHNASSAAGEPKVYPMPVPHFAVECGVQTVCPVWSANLPAPHVAQVAFSVDLEAAGPYLPVAHAIPLQLTASVLVEYCPDVQSWQPPAFAYLPGTQEDAQTCASFAALAKNVPPAHVFSVHAELFVSVEYVPDVQGTQNASTVDVPAFTPLPAGQLGVP